MIQYLEIDWKSVDPRRNKGPTWIQKLKVNWKKHDIITIFFWRRIRDNLNESHVKTKVQQVDAASFTLGVAVSYLTEWIILKRPTLFPNFFYVFMGILLINR